MITRSPAGRRDAIRTVLAPPMAVLAFCLLAFTAAGVVHSDENEVLVPRIGSPVPPKGQSDAADAEDAKDAKDAKDAIGAQRTTNLSITVLNRVTRKPVSGATVIIRPVPGSTKFDQKTDTTTTSGACEPIDLPAGEVKIVVTAASMDSFVKQYVVAGASQSITIELTPD